MTLLAAGSLDEPYAPEQPVEPSLNASAVAVCIADAPWISYDVTLVDPDGLSTTRDVSLVFRKGVERYDLPLGALGGDDRLAGSVLCPGSAVDAQGTGAGWPGWRRVDGEWRDVGEDDLGWTRVGAHVTVEMNPAAAVAVAYPPSTPGCVPGPRLEPPSPRPDSVPTAGAAGAGLGPRALAATGIELAAPLLLGAGMLTGGLAFVTARRRPRL